jgi:hypothetical protein
MSKIEALLPEDYFNDKLDDPSNIDWEAKSKEILEQAIKEGEKK